jgi:hypothetical protein
MQGYLSTEQNMKNHLPNEKLAPSPRFKSLILVVVGLLLFAQFERWIYAPLMLDEFATWWITRTTLSNALWNTAPYNPHPLFYALEWFSTSIGGESALSLRFVSFASFALFGVLLYRYVKAQHGQGLLEAGVILVCIPNLVHALNARPYMLGLVFCLYAVIRASAEFSRPNFCAAFLSCILAFLTHQSFISAFFIPPSFYIFDSRRRLPSRALLVAWFFLCSVIFFLAIAVLFPSLITLQQSQVQFYFALTLASFIQSAPTFSGLLLELLVVALALRVFSGKYLAKEILQTPGTRAGLMITAVPVLVTAVLSALAGTPLFVERYLLVTIVGGMVVLSGILRCSRSPYVLTSLLIFPTTVALRTLSVEKPTSDWASVVTHQHAASSRTSKLVIVETPHAQALLPEWNETARLSSAWTCPVTYYLPLSKPSLVVPLVEQPSGTFQDSTYRLPWLTLDLASFHVVELYRTSVRYPPALNLASSLENELLRLSFKPLVNYRSADVEKVVFGKDE